jgi:hypothetical protein
MTPTVVRNRGKSSVTDHHVRASVPSELPEYRNFELAPSVYPVTGIADFTPPTIEVRAARRDALVYMTDVRTRLVTFLRDFISLCGFERERAPNTYFKCDSWDNQFAVRKNGKVHLRGVSYHGPTIANFLRGRNMEQTVRSTRVARMSPQRARDRIVREVAGERGPDDRRWSCLRPVT